MTTSQEYPLPGSNMVGRGIYLMPHQPYQLRGFLFTRGRQYGYYSVETKKKYTIPAGYEVNESPPMPADKALNQVMIEESFERFDKSMSLDANLAAGSRVFSINANLSTSNQVRSDEEAYYALRSSFIPLWSVFLSTAAGFPNKEMEAAVPVSFSTEKRRMFDAFFAQYGTHYVKRVWVGGKADLSFTIAKSANMSKSDIQAGISASFGGIGDNSMNAREQEQKEQLRSNSECLVTGKGGDELKLAALSNLDEKLYNQWLGSIKDNPQVIELEVEGLWNLIEDEHKAKALQDAYSAATTFTRISSMLRIRDKILFIRGDKYSAYDTRRNCSTPEQSIDSLWPKLAETGIMEIDTVLDCIGLVSSEGRDLSNAAFFFDESNVVMMDLKNGSVEEGYPMSLQDSWPGLGFERIDAALNAGPDTLYFFMGNRYVRYNYKKKCVEEGYPQLISQRWAGVTFDRIDAVTYWGNGKVYFFRGDQYIRYDMTMYRADPGYPRSIIGSYVEDIKFFE